MTEKLLEKITLPSAVVERIYCDCKCHIELFESKIFEFFKPYVKRKYPNCLYLLPSEIPKFDEMYNDSMYANSVFISFRHGGWSLPENIKWVTSDGNSGEIDVGDNDMEVDVIMIQRDNKKILLDEKALREIENILERGNSAEVRKRKDSVVILEVKAKQQYTVAING